MSFSILDSLRDYSHSFQRSSSEVSTFAVSFRRPLKTTFDMTTLIFSTGGCPSYPFYSFKRGPWYPVFRENPSREVATKDHSSSNPPKGNPPDLKTKVDVSKVDVTFYSGGTQLLKHYSCRFGRAQKKIDVTAAASGGIPIELLNYHGRLQLLFLISMELIKHCSYRISTSTQGHTQ